MSGGDYKDLLRTPKSIAEWNPMLASNSVQLARPLKRRNHPGISGQSSLATDQRHNCGGHSPPLASLLAPPAKKAKLSLRQVAVEANTKGTPLRASDCSYRAWSYFWIQDEAAPEIQSIHSPCRRLGLAAFGEQKLSGSRILMH